eukprot:gene7093-7635_t
MRRAAASRGGARWCGRPLCHYRHHMEARIDDYSRGQHYMRPGNFWFRKVKEEQDNPGSRKFAQ